MAKRLIFFVLALACVISCFVLPSLAAIVPADYVEYPSLNAFPYPYEPQSGFMLNYITYPDDKSITFSGTPDGGFDAVRSAFILKDWQTGLNVTQKVTFSFKFGTLASTSHRNVKLRCQVVSVVGGTTYYDVSYYSGGYVSFDMAPTDKLNIYIRFEANVYIAPFKFYPVLNYGATRYPYQPYVNALLDDSYSEGVTAGRGQGFNEGVIEGLDRAETIMTTPFSGAALNVRFVKDGLYTYVFDVPYDRSYDGISFSSTLEYLQSEYASNLSQCDFLYVEILFVNDVVYQNTPIMILGETSVNSGYMYLDYLDDRVDTNNPYVVTADRSDANTPVTFVLDVGAPPYSPAKIDSFSVRVDNPSSFLGSFIIYSPTGSYDSGYVDGLKAGLSENAEDAYLAGSTEGYKQGFTEGKKEGLKAAESGDWMSLMSAVVEAPVHAFQSLFNFELFGFDMRMMISSVLTISIFILILKKIGVI